MLGGIHKLPVYRGEGGKIPHSLKVAPMGKGKSNFLKEMTTLSKYTHNTHFIFRQYSEASYYKANRQSRPCPVCPQFVSFDTPKEAAIHVRLPEHKEYVSMFLEKVKSKKN